MQGKVTLYAFRTTNEIGMSIIVFRESEFNFEGSGLVRESSYDLHYYNAPLESTDGN